VHAKRHASQLAHFQWLSGIATILPGVQSGKLSRAGTSVIAPLALRAAKP
jgi:hypothetical protein